MPLDDRTAYNMQDPVVLSPKENADAGGTLVAAPPTSTYGKRVKPVVNLTQEYVSGRPDPRIARYIEALPQYIDDVTTDFGLDLYDKMLTDSQVYSCVEILKLTVVAEGWQIAPAQEEKDHPEFQEAKKYADFCERMIHGMEKPFDQFLYEMLDGCAKGNRLAEKIYRLEEDGEDKGLLLLNKLKIKPRRTYSFVVDAFKNVLGIVAIIPGRSYILYQGSTLFDPDKLPNILPRDKFCLFTHNPLDNDPRGQSILRAAYDPWWCKLQSKGEYLKYLAQFGSPTIWGTTSPESTSQSAFTPDSLGNPTGQPGLTPEQTMLAALQAMRNGSCGAFPPGSEINLLQSATGANFLDAFAFYDKQITKAILGQTLATEEGEHQARAASETHKDILDMVMRNVRRMMESMVKNDIFKQVLEINFGKAVARKYTPRFQLGKIQESDWNTDVSAVSSLVASKFLAPSQVAYIDERLNLPPRTDKSPYEMEVEQAAKGGGPGAPEPPLPPKAGGAAPQNPLVPHFEGTSGSSAAPGLNQEYEAGGKTDVPGYGGPKAFSPAPTFSRDQISKADFQGAKAWLRAVSQSRKKPA